MLTGLIEGWQRSRKQASLGKIMAGSVTAKKKQHESLETEHLDKAPASSQITKEMPYRRVARQFPALGDHAGII